MAERKSRESGWRYGWPSIVAIGVVVVAAGFTVGVLAGIAWEEPRLVVGYLSGQTEGIDWAEPSDDPEAGELAADDAASDTPNVAAPPPLGRHQPVAAADAKPAQSASRSAAPVEREVAPPRPTSGFAVQVGAFSEKRAAEALAKSLRADGYSVYLSPSDATPPSWRVRVGPTGTRPEAEKLARRLETAKKLPTWVLGEGS